MTACNPDTFELLQQELAALAENWGSIQAITVQGDGTDPDALCLYSEVELEGDAVLWLNQRLQGWEKAHFNATVTMHTGILLCGHQLRMAILNIVA